jgi:pyruvate dehydrogenase E1 component beta subunit
MSGGTINVPMVFRGPNGAAAGVAAQHSQVIFLSFILIGISSDYCRQFGKGLQNS